MANMLDKYRDTTDELPVPTDNAPTEKVKRPYALKKKDRKALNRLAKALRKQYKSMVAKQKAEEESAKKVVAGKAVAEKVDKRQQDSGVAGFFKKLGDAICKAVPKVLTALATLAFSYFVKARFTGKVLQAA